VIPLLPADFLPLQAVISANTELVAVPVTVTKSGYVVGDKDMP
jgi:hypothetical protein